MVMSNRMDCCFKDECDCYNDFCDECNPNDCVMSVKKPTPESESKEFWIIVSEQHESFAGNYKPYNFKRYPTEAAAIVDAKTMAQEYGCAFSVMKRVVTIKVKTVVTYEEY